MFENLQKFARRNLRAVPVIKFTSWLLLATLALHASYVTFSEVSDSCNSGSEVSYSIEHVAATVTGRVTLASNLRAQWITVPIGPVSLSSTSKILVKEIDKPPDFTL